jgi:hypothetical protein
MQTDSGAGHRSTKGSLSAHGFFDAVRESRIELSKASATETPPKNNLASH